MIHITYISIICSIYLCTFVARKIFVVVSYYSFVNSCGPFESRSEIKSSSPFLSTCLEKSKKKNADEKINRLDMIFLL